MDTHYTAINYISKATCCSCMFSHTHTRTQQNVPYSIYKLHAKYERERGAAEFSVINFTYLDRESIKPFFPKLRAATSFN